MSRTGEPSRGLCSAAASASTQKRVRSLRPTAESLEPRLALSTALPDIVMVSATATDSQSVTVDYKVENAPIDGPITFGISRSADAQAQPGAVAVATATVADPASGHPTLDQSGQPATAVGEHIVKLPVPGGLPPNPSHPYVVVTADPQNAIAEASKANNVASFRKYVVGVITHGGIQPMKWKAAGPPWEQMMAVGLRNQGYDTVISYNWVVDSNHPGRAARQGPWLARRVLAAADTFPANAPVDVHFIGHSEGAVVNTQAVLYLGQHPDPRIAAGYLKETMLDPHAASNNVPGQQYSVSNDMLGRLARTQIDNFQSRAHDPPIVVPPNVNEAEVFYQHTPVGQTHTSNGGVYNLWGQVPVHGPAHYFDLTGPGISHAGTFGVADWYRANVVPTLGAGDTLVESNVLTVSPAPIGAAGIRGRAEVSSTSTPSYSGSAAPGATVHLVAARGNSKTLAAIGRTVAEPNGSWTITTAPLAPGGYRLKAVATIPSAPNQRSVHMRPTAWPSPLIVPRGA